MLAAASVCMTHLRIHTVVSGSGGGADVVAMTFVSMTHLRIRSVVRGSGGGADVVVMTSVGSSLWLAITSGL